MSGNAIAKRSGSRILASPHLTEDAVLVRFADGTRNEYGEWVEGGETTTDIRVVTEPFSGTDRENLPEGVREAEGRKFWTTLPVTAVKAGTQDGDLIRYDSKDYKVVRLNAWGGFSLAWAVLPEAIPE